MRLRIYASGLFSCWWNEGGMSMERMIEFQKRKGCDKCRNERIGMYYGN